MSATRPPNLLDASIHEAGHAIARLALDELAPLPAPPILSVIVDCHGNGRCEARPRVELPYQRYDAGTPERTLRDALVRFDAIAAWAGRVAEFRHRYGGERATGMLESEIGQWINKDQHFIGTDDACICWCCELLKNEDRVTEAGSLLRATQAVVAAEWTGIKRMAGVLMAAGKMDGAAFEVKWREVRPSKEMREQCLTRWEVDHYPAAITSDMTADALRACCRARPLGE